jgi:hypothetical protein
LYDLECRFFREKWEILLLVGEKEKLHSMMLQLETLARAPPLLLSSGMECLCILLGAHSAPGFFVIMIPDLAYVLTL